MLSALVWIAEQLGLLALKRWWAKSATTPLENAYAAKEREAKDMAALDLDKSSLVRELRKHTDD